MNRLLPLFVLASLLGPLAPRAAEAQCNDTDLDGDGYSCLAGDCNDNNPNVYPGAPELCNGVDDNCDNITDNPPDADGDGFNVCQGDCDDGNPNRFPGNPEVCDGVDNDCNASTQDASITRPCYTGPNGTINVGLCRAGTEACSGPSGWSGQCTGQVTPQPEQCDNQDHDCNGQNYNGFPDSDGDGFQDCRDCRPNDPASFPGANEICDGFDNDCDNLVDERNAQGQPLQQACYTGPPGTLNVGLCRAGNQQCTGGSWGACGGQVTPQPEQCDNQDHDCNGQNYNGFPDSDGDGFQDCRDCRPNDPTSYPGAPEVCDGVDNNCDSFVDNRNAQGQPLQQACYAGPPGTQNVGLCRGGTQECISGQWAACGGAQVLPSPEQCNNQDHDCDGQNYNGFPDSDGDGFQDCRDCRPNDPASYPGATEVCDGVDNDCDNLVDERNAQGQPLQQSCYPGPPGTQGVGRCRSGLQECTTGSWGTCGGPLVLPEPEQCDATDWDCDGNAYNGFPDSDGDGYADCIDCRPSDPASYPGATEVCDGVDNDCDNLVDERNAQGQPLRNGCYTGPAGTQGVGTCRAGWSYCSAGTFGSCTEQTLPSAEICDTVDNDCDGQTDEGFDQDGDGYTVCGAPADCNDADAAMFPGNPEVCDGKDNNCNGQTDEATNGQPLARSCYTGPSGTAGVGQCRSGLNLCEGASGYAAACTGEILPGPETCDGVDNDCNGETDEAFDEDGDGYTNCGGDCDDANPAVNPGALEVCNGVDDDCDEIVDGTETECYTGPAGTLGVGLCRAGTSACENGVPVGDCVGEVLPAAETCDLEDNDCDGEVDEGFDQDGDGVSACAGDCEDDNPFVSPLIPERCDCYDNDCDGDIDENPFGGTVCDQGACHDFDGDGYTNCEGDCNDFSNAVFPGAREVCGDELDNDCDGLVDEDVDEDGDGYTSCGGDCDDRFPEINPGAAEVCDGFDNDCDGEVDEGFDEDGDFATTCAGDCDDTNPLVSPFRREVCGDGIDNDCDGTIDDDTDADADGFSVCDGDCNDYNASVYPGATEVCDGQDNNCNGRVDEGFDQDGDTFATCFGDCDDADPAINPFAPELIDGIDNNCNGEIDEGQADNDGDGFGYLCGDCDDNDPSTGPWAEEICDGRDNDCDGVIDRDPSGRSVCSSCNDVDQDGVTDCDGDCDDNDPTVRPGLREVCDGKDNTCDGRVDFDIVSQTNVCVLEVDAGVPEAGGPALDAATTEGDASAPGSADAGTNLPLDGRDPLALDCGCRATSSGPGAPGWTGALLLLFLPLLRRRRARGSALLVLLLIGGALGGCTEVQVGPGAELDGGRSDADPTGGDGSVADAAGRDLGARDGGGLDGGRPDLGPPTEGPCRLEDPERVVLRTLPGSGTAVAVHRGTEVSVLSGVDALALDDEDDGLRAFALSMPVPAGLDPTSPLSPGRIIDELLDPLFSSGIPGVTGVATRVDESVKQSFLHDARFAARTAREITMSNDVLPAAVRSGLLAGLSGRPLREIGGLPPVDPSRVARVLEFAALVEIEPLTPPRVSVVVALGASEDQASLAPLLNDLSNSTHLAPSGSALELRCETSTTSALAVDFLWVVDNSASMQEEQSALAGTAGAFFAALEASKIDFRLGVVTTDGEALRGGAFTTSLTEFQELVKVGINGNGREQGLEFAVRALDRARTSSAGEARLRPEATTAVIFFSDEDSVLLRSIDDYVAALREREVLPFAIVGPRPRGCAAVGRGVARVGEQYLRVVDQLNSTSASICAADLSESIREILLSAAGRASQTRLESVPISGSLEVGFQTGLIPRSRSNGFEYEPTANSVLFFGDASPVEGTPYRASYYVLRPPEF